MMPTFSRSLQSALPLMSVLATSAIALSVSVPAAHANTVSLSPGFRSTEVRGTAGGGTALQDIAGRSETSTGSCTGFAGSQPDHILRLNSGFKDLTVLVNSGVDTTLVVKGPGGTWCNDDFQGKNAGLDGQWQSGDYRVWVGTQGRNQSVNYTLRVTQD